MFKYGELAVLTSLEHKRENPKVKLLCAVSSGEVCGHFFFVVVQSVSDVYHDILQL